MMKFFNSAERGGLKNTSIKFLSPFGWQYCGGDLVFEVGMYTNQVLVISLRTADYGFFGLLGRRIFILWSNTFSADGAVANTLV